MIAQALSTVWDAFRADRARVGLAVLGVVIGCSSLVLLSGLLEGAKDALLLASQQAAEDDLIEVRASRPPEPQRLRTTRPLRQADVAALRDSPILGGADVTSMRQGVQRVAWRKKKRQALIVGAPPEAVSIYRLEVAHGRFLTADDITRRRKVAVVGHKVWKELFDGVLPVEGLEIKTANDRFPVVGVLAHKPSMNDESPWQWDERVVLPETTFTLLIPSGPVRERRDTERIFVRLGDGFLLDRLGEVRLLIKAVLLRRHHGVENFRMAGEGDDEAKRDLVVGTVSLLIVTTALISLLVSGINIMNVMLVSVSERTREIGVRRAIGATRGQVMAQFLTEAILITVLGALLGILGGVALTAAVAFVLDRFLFAWDFHVTLWAPTFGLASSVLVGALFGWLPAWRAARLDPVEALRTE